MPDKKIIESADELGEPDHDDSVAGKLNDELETEADDADDSGEEPDPDEGVDD